MRKLQVIHVFVGLHESSGKTYYMEKTILLRQMNEKTQQQKKLLFFSLFFYWMTNPFFHVLLFSDFRCLFRRFGFYVISFLRRRSRQKRWDWRFEILLLQVHQHAQLRPPRQLKLQQLVCRDWIKNYYVDNCGPVVNFKSILRGSFFAKIKKHKLYRCPWLYSRDVSFITNLYMKTVK